MARSFARHSRLQVALEGLGRHRSSVQMPGNTILTVLVVRDAGPRFGNQVRLKLRVAGLGPTGSLRDTACLVSMRPVIRRLNLG